MSEDTDQALHAQDVDYTDGETTFQGYLAVLRTVAEPRPCVVLSHDWSGLNNPTKCLAERYARLGYACFAVDVYGKGVRGDSLGDNSRLMSPLMGDRALLRRRLLAGFTAAIRLPGIDTTRTAAVGYCFGGLCALDLARAGPPDLKAVVSFHGGLGAPGLGEQGPIEPSILLLHGWEDPVVPVADVLDFAKEMTAAKADWQLHAYGHARHAFTFEEAKFPERGVVYDRKADERSWAAMRRHLAAAFGEDRAEP
ncbi:dienelactone hydrolase family protein [Lichenifustis flavocetrariae]|uniref:Dienelactone hydrolase family protein n=1 Tax=Lichenifustis flavocetrariae TaxID=2949735 RepID=A0AA42CMD4_9HYPH|nr:dienelactone hydrolase family protein [Lichenifustis flavocetrariae]MCW6512438.1 dienelactone hydrolase family protein [Lichenifustis flavocetrariae]